MLYSIKAYESRTAAHLGTMPVYTSKTGDYATAKRVAQELAESYGAAVVCNTETGNRDWFYND